MLTIHSPNYRTKNNFSYEEKMAIIQEYLTTEISLTQMVKKYHIGWTTIPKWMRKFGIPIPNEAPVQIPMSEETKKPEKKDTVEALEARLQELQAELDREKLKNLALNTMIEVAEKELQIDIRKKPGAKQRAEDAISLNLIAEYRKDMGRRKRRHLPG